MVNYLVSLLTKRPICYEISIYITATIGMSTIVLITLTTKQHKTMLATYNNL